MLKVKDCVNQISDDLEDADTEDKMDNLDLLAFSVEKKWAKFLCLEVKFRETLNSDIDVIYPPA